jgi:hypothetical protein
MREVRQYLLIEVSKVFRAVMDVRPHHGVQRGRQKGRGTRGQKALFSYVHEFKTRPELQSGNFKFNKENAFPNGPFPLIMLTFHA